jgi:hypothetical protein
MMVVAAARVAVVVAAEGVVVVVVKVVIAVVVEVTQLFVVIIVKLIRYCNNFRNFAPYLQENARILDQDKNTSF